MKIPMTYGLELSARISDQLTLSSVVTRTHRSDFRVQPSTRTDVLLAESGMPARKGKVVLNGESDDTN